MADSGLLLPVGDAPERQSLAEFSAGDFAAVWRARGVGVDSSARAALSCARGCKRLRPHPMRLGQAADEGYGALGVQSGVMLRHVALLMLSRVMIAALWIVCCAM